jgi:hypothetical protein
VNAAGWPEGLEATVGGIVDLPHAVVALLLTLAETTSPAGGLSRAQVPRRRPVPVIRLLRPSGARCRRPGGQHLACLWPLEHVRRTNPFGRDHEQSAPVWAAERAGEAAAVKLDGS